MKWNRHVFAALAFLVCLPAWAQDAAIEEKLNRLSAQFEDIIAAQRAQQKQLTELANELEGIRSRLNKPGVEYASKEDLKVLADAIREVDRKRLEDNEKIEKQLVELAKILTAASVRPKPTKPAVETAPKTSTGPMEGYEYEVQSGDTLSVIAQAYRERNIKVTVDQILKANPGLNPNRLIVGKKIFIPAPTQ